MSKYSMTLKEELEQLGTSAAGAISICRQPGTKHYRLRCELITVTKFLPDDIGIGDRIWCVLNDITSWPICKCGCGEPVKQIRSKYLPYHSNRDTDVKRKKADTTKQNYGVENPSQSEEIKRRKDATSIKNWGETSYMKTEAGKEMHRQCVRTIHGVDNPYQIPEVKQRVRKIWHDNKESILEKRSETSRKNFYNKLVNGPRCEGIIPMFSMEEYMGVHDEYKFKCKRCDTQFISSLIKSPVTSVPRCPTCFPLISMRGTSNLEREIQEIVRSVIACKCNDRKIIAPYELDVIVPDVNVAIELDGIYWHSELNGIDKNYHLMKTELCEKRDWKLIHVFEDELIDMQSIVSARIISELDMNKNVITVDDCNIIEVSSTTAADFLISNHIRGTCSSNVRYGLVFDDELIAIMTFRPDKKYTWELTRYSPRCGYKIIDGANRMFERFISDYQPSNIISYIDRRWSNGIILKELGFKLLCHTEPEYWYVKGLQRFHKSIFQKQLLKNVLDKFDPSMTEWENMQINGYDRIWDCGHSIYEYRS